MKVVNIEDARLKRAGAQGQHVDEHLQRVLARAMEVLWAKSPALPELPEGMEYDEMLRPAVRCSVCEKLFEWPCDVSEYDHSRKEFNLCGGSPRCCP